MSLEFGQVPTAATARLSPFKIDIPDKSLQELYTLLSLSKLAPVTYEGLQTDRRYGITREWLQEAKSTWLNKFDWRAHEKHMNSFPQFTTSIVDDDGKEYAIHFVALFSKKPDAVPLMCLHGWPGSFLEFLPIMSILREKCTPETLPYHIIVPSLPGYTFSSRPPLDRDFRLEDIARLFNRLMISLGFGNGYVVQGGDIGSKVSRVIAATYENCKAVHINFCIMPEPAEPIGAPNELDREGLARTEEFLKMGSSYALQHATKPSTISLVLSASPLALLAWIGEKFLDWTDTDPSIDTILESVALYWLTETFPTAIYPYRQLFIPGAIGAHENPAWYLKKPFGFSFFPKELAPIPQSWAATTGDLVFYRQHHSGGHFAAVERPEVLLRDIEEFIAQVWET